MRILHDNSIDMKKHFTYLFAIYTLIIIALPACNKGGDDPGPPAPTKTDHITKSTWKFEKATASGIDVSTNPLIACYVDNTITFSSNLTGTISEGAVSCTPAAPTTFTWSFQSSETMLRLSFTLFTGGSPDFTIVKLDGTNLVVSQAATLGGMPTTIEVTFKH